MSRLLNRPILCCALTLLVTAVTASTFTLADENAQPESTDAAPVVEIEPTVEIPVEQPTIEPVQPTVEPVQPTLEPVQPTVEPIQPTVELPTLEPVEPTLDPVLPTDIVPTLDPMVPTLVVPTLVVPTDVIPDPAQPLSLPLSESFDDSARWTTSGAWTVADGTFAADTAARLPEQTLELTTSILVAGVNVPELLVRQKGTLSSADAVMIEVMGQGGEWAVVDQQLGSAVSLDWSARRVNLSPYTGQVIRLRVRVLALGDVPAGENSAGYWLDELAIREMEIAVQPVQPLPTLTPVAVLPTPTFQATEPPVVIQPTLDPATATPDIGREIIVPESTMIAPPNIVMPEITAEPRLDVMEDSESAEVAMMSMAAMDSVSAAAVPSSGTGLRAEYFNRPNLTERRTTRTDSRVNFNWRNGSPHRRIANNTFSTRWTGKIVPRYSQNYTFYFVSDDGARLFINNTPVFNRWGDNGHIESQGTIWLQAGQAYNIRLEYREGVGSAYASFYWSSPSQPREIVPTSQLYLPSASLPVVPVNPTPVPTQPPATSTPRPTQPPATSTPRPTQPPPTATQPPPTQQPPSTSGRPFNNNSIWNRRIPANVQVHPNSAGMISLLRQQTGNGYINIDGIQGPWSVPVFQASQGDTVHRICDSANYRPCVNVRFPNGFSPSPDADSKAVVLELFNFPPRAWAFYGMRNTGGNNWTALVGAYGWTDISSTGDGLTNRDGGLWGGRVAGWSYYAGLITPAEIEAGRIDHALNFVIPANAGCRCAVWPAIYGDGTGGASAIPAGTWLQFDPNVDVNSLGLTRPGRIIARALQEYGAWVGDTGANASFSAQQFQRRNSSGQVVVDPAPWNGLMAYNSVYNFPVQHLRVIVPNRNDFYLQ